MIELLRDRIIAEVVVEKTGVPAESGFSWHACVVRLTSTGQIVASRDDFRLRDEAFTWRGELDGPGVFATAKGPRGIEVVSKAVNEHLSTLPEGWKAKVHYAGGIEPFEVYPDGDAVFSLRLVGVEWPMSLEEQYPEWF